MRVHQCLLYLRPGVVKYNFGVWSQTDQVYARYIPQLAEHFMPGSLVYSATDPTFCADIAAVFICTDNKLKDGR